eukprot:1070020-Ditylum_brightwellii.AAC.1
MQNKCVDDDNGDGVNGSDDSTIKNLTHLSQAVNCHSMERGKQNVRVVGNKENGVNDSVDNNDDSANKQFTHLKNWMIVI